MQLRNWTATAAVAIGLVAAGAATARADTTSVYFDSGGNLAAQPNPFPAFQPSFPLPPTHNSALGQGALSSLAGGHDNTALGYAALQRLEAGGGNVAVGHFAGSDAEAGSMTVIGDFGATGTKADGTTAAAHRALERNGSGRATPPVGGAALRFNETGSRTPRPG